MTILVVGDQHFRFQLPYSAAIQDGRRGEWDEVIKKIHDTSKKCDAIVLLGDNFNAKHNHSSVNKDFVEFLNGFGNKHVYILTGNHETYGKSTALDFLKELNHPGWHIYTEPTKDVIIGAETTLEAFFMPYMTPGTLGVENLEEANKKAQNVLSSASILFHHHVVSGTKISGTTSEHLNEIVLPLNIEEKYNLVIGGHIHKGQQLSPKTFVSGSIFTHEVGEHEKHVLIVDTNTNKVEEIELPVRGIYQIEWNDNFFITELPRNSIIKMIVKDPALKDKIDAIREKLTEYFDSATVVEQYPNKRAKMLIDKTGGLDLSIKNLLKIYAETKEISYDDLTEAMTLIEENI